jgi:hypothetical protein
MSEEHLPFTATNGLPRVQHDVPLPPGQVAPLPRPRDDETKPFMADMRATEWLMAYA